MNVHSANRDKRKPRGIAKRTGSKTPAGSGSAARRGLPAGRAPRADRDGVDVAGKRGRGRPLVDDKRRRILDAALRVFAKKGYHGTTVPDVADEADVGTGTLYRYFEHKEALVNEVYRDAKLRLRNALTTPAAAPSTAPSAAPRAGSSATMRATPREHATTRATPREHATTRDAATTRSSTTSGATRAPVVPGIELPDLYALDGAEKWFYELWRRLGTFARAEPEAFRFLEMQDHVEYLDVKSRQLELTVLTPLFIAGQRLHARDANAPVDMLIALLWGAFVGVIKANRLGYLPLDDKRLAQAGEVCWRLIAPTTMTTKGK